MVRRIVVLALVALLGTAFMAYAETQNIKVSGDLESMVVFRDHFDLSGKNQLTISPLIFQNGVSSNLFLTIGRIKIDADLTDNVSATMRLIGQYNWGKSDTGPIPRDSDTNVDIDLANVTLKEFLYSPLTLIIGRQELHYGNDMIIGDSDTNRFGVDGNIPGDLNKRKSFDAIRAILDYNPLTVDLVFSKINATAALNTGAQLRFGIPGLGDLNGAYLERAGDRLDDDSDLFGINAKYDFGKWNTVGEAYYWYRRIGPRAFNSYTLGLITGGGDYKSDQLHTVGARIAMEPKEGLNFQVEAAMQQGRYNGFTDFWGPGGVGTHATTNHADRSAWALETSLGYTWKKAKYVPSLTAMYAYFSGEDIAWGVYTSPMKYRGWDPMFENQTFGHIANALFPQSGMQLIGLTGTMKPREDITIKGEYYNYFLTSTNSSDENGFGLPSYYYDGLQMLGMEEGKKHLGHEIDVTLTYDYTEDVQLSLLSGIFIPGSVFMNANNNTASEIIGSVKVTF